jgi:hypothetical protein
MTFKWYYMECWGHKNTAQDRKDFIIARLLLSERLATQVSSHRRRWAHKARHMGAGNAHDTIRRARDDV